MKRCINANSIQVKELSDELGLKPIIVAAKIAVWQDKNNTDEFPSANDLVGGMFSNDKVGENQTEITIGNKKYKQGIYSFKEIFENIGEKSYANKLLKMLYGLSNQNIDNMKIEIVDNIEEAGHFDNGIIRLNINSTNPETVFTHEVIHALTALKLAYWKKNSPKVYKDMEKVWIDSKAILDPSDERYEFSSIDEFYAALSKQSFVEELAKIKNPSFIDKLIQMFKDMLSKLGIKVEGTLAEKALNNLTEIVQTKLDKKQLEEGQSYLKKKLFAKSDEEWGKFLANKKPTVNQLVTIGKLAEIDNRSKYDDVKKVYEDAAGNERTRVSNITSITNPFTGDSTEEVKENSAALGNIFDGILNDLILGKSIDEIKNIYKLDGTMLEDFIKEIQIDIFNNPKFKDGIFISQHAVSVDNLEITTKDKDGNESSEIYNMTGTTDVLVIYPNGKVSIIDLKTTKSEGGKWKLANGGQPVTQQYIYKTMYELNGVEVEDMSLFIKEIEKNENQSEILSTIPAKLIVIDSNILKPSVNLINMEVVSVVDDIFDFGGMSTEQSDEADEEINSDVIDVKALEFWKEVEKELEKSATFLESSTSDNDAKMIYKDFKTTSKYYKRKNTKKEGNLTEFEKVVNQAATLALYVAKLKHQLITKPSSEGTTSFNTLIKKPLLEIAKIINENSKKPMTYEQNEAYVEMSNYIQNFIKDKNSLILQLKQVLKESANQQQMINVALENESTNYYSAIKDIEEVLDAMTKIQTLLKDSSHFVKLISVGNEEQLSKAVANERAKYDRDINKINEKIRQKQAKITPENKDVITAEIKELEESKPTPPETDITLNVAKELEDGTDGGLIVALFGTINDFGDKSLTLLRNRIEDAFKKLQTALIPIGKRMTEAWKEFNDGNFNMNDDTIFEGFTEIVEYMVRGVKKTELHFVTDRDLGKYYRELNETKDRINEIREEIEELKKKRNYEKGIKAEQILKNKKITEEIKDLYKQINEVEEVFVKKQAYKKDVIAPSKVGNLQVKDVLDYLKKTHDNLISLMGEKDGIWAFTQFMRENYNLSRMMSEGNNIGVSQKDYVANMILNNFKGITLRESYSSILMKPKESEYFSDKLSKLTPKQRKMYDVLTSTYYEAQKNLPEHLRPKTRVPSVSKDIVQKFMNKDVSTKELFNEMLSNHFSDELENGTDNRIPVYYTSTALQPHEISKNLVSTVLLFTKQAMAFKTKAKTLHIAQEMQNTMGKTKKQGSNGRQMLNSALKKIGINQAIPVGGDWRNWFLDLWIDQVFYGKTNRPMEVTIMGKKVRVDKILQKLAGFSAFGTLGGVKIVSHLTNISMANASNLLESTGYFKESEVQPLFSKSQYLAASVGDSWKTMLDMLTDHMSQTEYSDSIYAQIMDELEPLQGEYFDRFGTQLNKNFLGKVFSGSTWFAPMHLGDVQPQVCAMIAMLNNMEVTVKGEKTTLWKALTTTNDLEANWKTIENEEEVRKQLKDNKRKLDELNKKMHGNYQSIANVDRPISRQSTIGQLFEMYRKFIVPGMLLRWDKGHSDLQRNEWVEGRYRTLFGYIINDMRWMLKAENKITPLDILMPTSENINEIRKYYSDSQIVNIRKAVVEQMFITCTSLLAVLLYGLSKAGDDDDEVLNLALVTSASVIFRVSRDFNFFAPISVDSPLTETADFTVPISTPIPDYLRVFKSPFAVMRTVDNLQQMITLFTSDPTEVYKSGEYKDQVKLKVKALKAIGATTGTTGKDYMRIVYEKTN
jgi:hypothetical protein